MDDLKYYKRGLAIGRSDIRNDCMHFHFYKEHFIVYGSELKTRNVYGQLVAKIEDVRKHANGRST